MVADGVPDVGAAAGNRSEKRARVLLAAKIRTASGEEQVRLRDLSRKGALIECADPPMVGSEVVFQRGSTIVPARVAWRAASKAGLEFLHMIDESEVLVHVARPRPEVAQPRVDTNQQRFRRPRIMGEDITPHERKLAEAWGVAVGISISDD